MAVATLSEGKILLKSSYEEKDAIKLITGRKWNPEIKKWELPLSVETYEMLLEKLHGVHIDSKVILAINELKEQYKAVNSFKNTEDDIDPLEPMPIKVKPYLHQIQGYNIGITINDSGLFMEQGCGKTLTAIAVMGQRYLSGQIKRVLIVAPSSVLPVWLAEIEKVADFETEAVCLEKSIKDREKVLNEWKPSRKLQIAIINYEAVWRLVPYTVTRTATGKERRLWQEKKSIFYTKWKPDMIICDESQRIKSPTALQSKGLHKLSSFANYKMILTGTPVTQSPLDVFSQFKFLNENVFGESFYAFRNRYAVMGGYGNHKVLRYLNMEDFKKKVHSITYRVTKKDALDLPETVDQELYCELEPAAEKRYQMMKDESLMQLQSGGIITASNILSKLLRLSQITGGFLADDDRIICISEAKLKVLEEAITDIIEAGDKKVVVFARFIPEIKSILKMCEKNKFGYSWIAGEVKDRGEQVRRFQEDPECKVFIAQIQTAGLGITLTAADTAIFYSLSYSFADYDQAKARIHRIGQKNKCTYVHLLAKNTVDKKVLKVLKDKKSIADEVIDKWHDYFE